MNSIKHEKPPKMWLCCLTIANTQGVRENPKIYWSSDIEEKNKYTSVPINSDSIWRGDLYPHIINTISLSLSNSIDH